MAAPMRALLGLAAAVLSVLAFQGMWALLHAAGLVRRPRPIPSTPCRRSVPPVADFCHRGRRHGLAFGLALPFLPRAPMWLPGLGLCLIAVLVGWFVAAPLKGKLLAGVFVARRMPVPVLLQAPRPSAWAPSSRS